MLSNANVEVIQKAGRQGFFDSMKVKGNYRLSWLQEREFELKEKREMLVSQLTEMDNELAAIKEGIEANS